jgi:hypothetical protein
METPRSRRTAHPAAVLAPGLALTLLLVGGCRAPGSGELRGVGYHVDLVGTYSLYRHSEREHVWVPSGDERPLISVRLAPNPRYGGQPPAPCGKENPGVATSTGGFRFMRDGAGVKLALVQSPGGEAVHVSRCVPPGAESLDCVASYLDGAIMSPERRSAAIRACESLARR